MTLDRIKTLILSVNSQFKFKKFFIHNALCRNAHFYLEIWAMQKHRNNYKV